jgi:hypothetical protein
LDFISLKSSSFCDSVTFIPNFLKAKLSSFVIYVIPKIMIEFYKFDIKLFNNKNTPNISSKENQLQYFEILFSINDFNVKSTYPIFKTKL